MRISDPSAGGRCLHPSVHATAATTNQVPCHWSLVLSAYGSTSPAVRGTSNTCSSSLDSSWGSPRTPISRPRITNSRSAARYNALAIMELLSNFVWMVAALALWVWWMSQPRSTRGTSLRPGIGVQLVGLAVLTMILLPVISVSDDLQASHNPAEVERSCIRSDQHVLLPGAPAPAPSALSIVIGCLLMTSARTITFISPDSSSRCEQTDHASPLACRPPPPIA